MKCVYGCSTAPAHLFHITPCRASFLPPGVVFKTYHRICSLHFDAVDIKCNEQRVTLRKTAVLRRGVIENCGIVKIGHVSEMARDFPNLYVCQTANATYVYKVATKKGQVQVSAQLCFAVDAYEAVYLCNAKKQRYKMNDQQLLRALFSRFSERSDDIPDPEDETDDDLKELVESAIVAVKAVTDKIIDRRHGQILNIIIDQLHNILAKQPSYSSDSIMFAIDLKAHSSKCFQVARRYLKLPCLTTANKILEKANINGNEASDKNILNILSAAIEDENQKVVNIIIGK